MKNAFNGQVALITGASSGIGAALAREFARQGAKVVLAARRKERIDELAAQFGGDRALPVVCDVTQDADVQQAVAAAVRQFGRLDVVVANAGIGISGDFEQLTMEQYRTVMETNVFGVLRTVRAALDELKQTRGRVAIVGSVSGIISTPGNSAYCTSKFAVRALALALRDELARDGISVTHVAPGFVESEIRLKDNTGALKPGAADPVPAWLVMPADAAARQIVRALAKRKAEVVITLHGKLAVLLQRLFPWVIAAISRGLSRRHGTEKSSAQV